MCQCTKQYVLNTRNLLSMKLYTLRIVSEHVKSLVRIANSTLRPPYIVNTNIYLDKKWGMGSVSAVFAGNKHPLTTMAKNQLCFTAHVLSHLRVSDLNSSADLGWALWCNFCTLGISLTAAGRMATVTCLGWKAVGQGDKASVCLIF